MSVWMVVVEEIVSIKSLVVYEVALIALLTMIIRWGGD